MPSTSATPAFPTAHDASAARTLATAPAAKMPVDAVSSRPPQSIVYQSGHLHVGNKSTIYRRVYLWSAAANCSSFIQTFRCGRITFPVGIQVRIGKPVRVREPGLKTCASVLAGIRHTVLPAALLVPRYAALNAARQSLTEECSRQGCQQVGTQDKLPPLGLAACGFQSGVMKQRCGVVIGRLRPLSTYEEVRSSGLIKSNDAALLACVNFGLEGPK